VLDLVLRNGTVFDGTGAEGFRADIGIQGEWIREVGDLSRIQARRVLECVGLYVAPEFARPSGLTPSLISCWRRG